MFGFCFVLETRAEAERRGSPDVNSTDELGENGHASTERPAEQQRHPGKFRSFHPAAPFHLAVCFL